MSNYILWYNFRDEEEDKDDIDMRLVPILVEEKLTGSVMRPRSANCPLTEEQLMNLKVKYPTLQITSETDYQNEAEYLP